jgi:phospholipid/cholesterol/gamma-HCH transport system substrate-binding protein
MPTPGQIRWARFRVAAVSVAAFAILGELVYLLAGGTILQPRTTLYVFIPDATGLVTGAPVRVDGVGVGKVTSVALTGSTEPARVIKVTIKAESARLSQIPVDSLAELSPDSLVGDMFVDVTGGRSPRHIPPNGEIPFKASPGLLKSVDLTQFDQALSDIDAVVTDIEQGRSRVGQFIMGEAVYADVIKRVSEAQRGFRAAISVTTGIGKEIQTDELYRRISDPLVELDQSLQRLQTARTAPGVYLNDTAEYAQLLKTAEDLRASVAAVRAGELMSSDAAYAAWTASVQSLIRKVDEANSSPLLETSQAYEQLDGAARELRDSLKDFRENPQKFLRLKIF